MNQDKMLGEFVELAALLKSVEERYDEARKKIVATLEKKGIEKLEDPQFGIFTVSHRVTYEFSDAVKKLEEKVKIAKTKEQQKGLAKVKSDTTFLKYTAPAGAVAE